MLSGRYPAHTPAFTKGGNIQVSTMANGEDYVSFPASPCSEMMLVNDTGTDIEWLASTGIAITLKADATVTIKGLQTTQEVAVRRKDKGTTPVTVKGRYVI